MDHEFWQQRWHLQEIGFHRDEPHPFLLEFWSQFFKNYKRVLVPLCGKATCLDFLWKQGLDVCGVELSEIAVESYFAERKIHPKKTLVQGKTNLEKYTHKNLTVYRGDYFDFEKSDFEVFYDRAASVALPFATRQRYICHTAERLVSGGKGFLISLTHSEGGGPPFSLDQKQIIEEYSPKFSIEHILTQESDNVPGGNGAEHFFILTKL